ncbi:MAG: glycosyltransferase family 2 protein, partial [Candidatus Saccharibacteria bacterium]|nr:glycosyltransferase family 2 protein [Candidatus Saccharibacteria bacterium]
KHEYNDYIPLEKLPSVSVCIPVRNEHHAIAECLELVLASDYPKMEVIVLDDESVDNTSDIIRSFAHAGVRFIKGDKLPRGWIGKNKAFEKLTSEASGEYILFLSVDTKIQPRDISTLIRYTEQHQLGMIGVMPQRRNFHINVIFGTMRFLWELVLQSRSLPATSTSAWMVKADELKRYGNFWENHRAVIRPETSLAKLFYDQQQYRFLIANKFLSIGQEKKWRSQLATTVRTSSRIFSQSPYLRASILVILASIIISTGVIIFNLITSTTSWIKIVSSLILFGFGLTYCQFTRLAWRKAWFLGLISWIWTVPQELFLLVISILRSNLHILSWKGRRLPFIR